MEERFICTSSRKINGETNFSCIPLRTPQRVNNQRNIVSSRRDMGGRKKHHYSRSRSRRNHNNHCGCRDCCSNSSSSSSYSSPSSYENCDCCSHNNNNNNNPVISIQDGNKVDVCHFDEFDQTYVKINISVNARNQHLANHPDGLVGDPVPGMSGLIFDSDCQPVVDNECPEVSAGANFADSVSSGISGIFLDGSASDGDGPLALVTTWTLVSGTTAVLFSDNNILNPELIFPFVPFPDIGDIFVFKLTAFDGECTVESTVQFTVD